MMTSRSWPRRPQRHSFHKLPPRILNTFRLHIADYILAGKGIVLEDTFAGSQWDWAHHELEPWPL
jgi:hypothetical protein